MLIPSVRAAGTLARPSISARKLNTPGVISFHVSTAGVSASVPDPAMGHTLPVSIDTPGGGESVASALTNPLCRLAVQLLLPQSGLLSLRTPKLEPPTISR